MRLQKEEKIVVVLLLMALGSLAVAFWTFGPDVGEASASLDSVAPRDSGSSLSLEGLVLEISPTKSGGNLLIRLDSTPLPVFIPASAGARELQEQLHTGVRIRVRGTVTDFQGTEELKISKASDVQRLER